MTAGRIGAAGVALLVLIFIGASLPGLDRFPKVNGDEAWIASPGHELVTRGRFGSPLLAGYHGAEARYFEFMPLFPLFSGASLALLGPGLLPLRLVSLAFAAAVIALTYLVGRRLVSPLAGLFAAGILVAFPLAAPLTSPFALATGIPLFDLARLARYDVAVPVFGLLSLLSLAGGASPRRFALAGAFAGLAALAHAYGAVWLAVVAVQALRAGPVGRLRRAAAALLGFGVALAPWLLFVSTDLSGWEAQNRGMAPQVGLLGDGFLAGVRTEWWRYAPVVRNALAPTLAPWLVLGGLLAGIRSVRRTRASVLLVALLVHLVAYALVLRPKSFPYWAPVWPLVALIAGAGFAVFFTAVPRVPARAALAALLAAATIEGARRIAALQVQARATTPYADVVSRLSERIPRGADLLALPSWWAGLKSHVRSYRSFFAPMALTSTRWADLPVPFAVAADAYPVDVVLLDPAFLRFVEDEERLGRGHRALAAEVRSWLAAGFEKSSGFEDPSYGRFEVWTRRRASAGLPPANR